MIGSRLPPILNEKQHKQAQIDLNQQKLFDDIKLTTYHYHHFFVIRESSNKSTLGEKTVEDRWLSVEEIGAYLGVKRDTIYKWISDKQMPAHRMGRLWKFQKSEVDEWVKAGGADENSKRNEGK